ncbi:hypothetical protein GCM10022384_68020 [Streptomyces marokkonensis]|uniref:Uncharacterized protein n=1 Tax=Streptomyces marokkonensis TaxID=324855 RepID=A0ABP7SP31_9ACTN
MQPAVGFLSEAGAEAEGPGQGELGAVEAGHDVFGAAPVVDGLGGVADHGVLGLVQEQEVGVDLRLGEGPDLEVVVVAEADGAFVGVLQVQPRLAGERDEVGGEFCVQAGLFQAAQLGDVVAGDRRVGRVAEAGHGAQGDIGEGLLGQVAVADTDGFGDAEGLAGLPGGAAGAPRRLV